MTYRQLQDGAWLLRQYVVRGRSDQDIADELGCDVHTVRRARARFGIESKRRDQWNPGNGQHARYECLANAQWLEEQYLGRGAADIAREVGCTQKAVTDALRRHGIRVRPRGYHSQVSRREVAA